MFEIAPIRGASARPVPARAALRGLLGLPPEEGPTRPGPLNLARAREARARPAPSPLRAQAQAAFRAVEGGGPGALDAALAVLEARILALEAESAGRAEALKLLRLYAGDDWARAVAGQALRDPEAGLRGALPGFLHDPRLAAGEGCACGGHG